MKRIALMLALVLALATAAAAGAAERRHSGRVVAVDRAAGTLRIEEMQSWNGPGTGLVDVTMRLTPQTAVAVVRRTPDVTAARWPDTFEARPVDADALRPGQFVTVTTGDGDVAEKVEIVEPDAA